MATTTKPGSPKIPTTMTSELACKCGKRLKVSIPSTGWRMSLMALSLANRWKLEHGYDVMWGDSIPAFCPKCNQTEHYPSHD